ncbi:MAG: hypothetical protein RLZZ591_1007 [Pseudomonadota bacterium]|jgi:hypothetical protein
METRFIKLLGASILALAAINVWAADAVSMNVPGSTDTAGRKVLTFIAKDPPGVRCNGNLQIAAELANTYRVPIQLVPSSLMPNLPAPSVFYGNQMLAADGKDHNGAVSFQMISDVLEVEGVAMQPKEGLLFNTNVRRNFDGLKNSIKSGGK